MKKTMLVLAFLAFTFGASTQTVTEVTDVILYEHHGISGTLGDSSAYDFVNHQYINSLNPAGAHPDRDLVEQNGLVTTAIPLGFTSGISSVWNGAFEGNGTTKYFLSTGFDYDNASQFTIVNAYDSDAATTEVNTVQQGEVYLARIRNMDYYVCA